MDKIMNTYTLTFKDKKIELHYQSQTFSKQLKPLYYAGFFMTLLMSIAQIIINENTFGELSPINIGVGAMTTINLFILYFKDELTQFSLTIENAIVLLLQINFLDQSITKQEYFAYGSMYASLQTCLCFVTDFQFSCPSIIVHIVFRVVAQIQISERMNFMIIGLAAMCLIFLVYVLYICNRAQRLQYLMTVKDDTINKQLETLINAPFSKIKYEQEKMKIEVQVVKQIDKLIGYSKELCDGCNIRNFLRSCKYQNQTLEHGFLNKSIPLNQSFVAMCDKKKIGIRICQFNIDHSFIVIQEYVINQNCKQKCTIPQKIKQELKRQFSQCQSTLACRSFKYGVMSILLMNHEELKTINITRLLNKLMPMFPFLQHISQSNKYQEIKIKTYSSQFQIFLLQVFNIILELELQREHMAEIQFMNFEACLLMKLNTNAKKEFFSYYNSNYFIQQIQPVILLRPLNFELEFAFKKYFTFKTLHDK